MPAVANFKQTRPDQARTGGDRGAGVRADAARVLDAVMHRGRSLKVELSTAQSRIADGRDRALLEAMVMAALRNRADYEATLKAWLPRPPGQRDNDLRALLYTGLAQLDAMGLPSHAAVDATVEAARLIKRTHQAGLVNAVLRRATRQPLVRADAQAGWPQWLLERLRADWTGDVDAILRASRMSPPMWLRVNRRKVDRDAYAARLREEGVDVRMPDHPVDALLLETPVAVSALPGFGDGLVSVQDGSAQQIADAFALKAGMRVLDACAAPGGKTAHLLEREPGLQVTAADIDARRLRRVEEGLQRLGLTAQTLVADAAKPDAWWDGRAFDAILVDAPCSATGILRRQPDILLHRRVEDVTALAALQSRMLDALWPTLAPGGTLVYATCSILREENDRQVEAFLQRTTDARLDPLDASFGRDTGCGHQRLPGEDGMDGFFYARLRKQ
ncbi:MAG: 16S rRNA (cytosine(967)-C(5))-methyltransferase RsmB [Proteobacteria bacterium]|nr:16S rRNA (cytosine(967)-C(5))-methyltransferase RsmB [Pseudomonadota bacterium]